MKKKFAVVKVFGHFGTFITLMDINEYCTCLAKTSILFESDSFNEASDWKAKYLINVNKITEV